MPEAVCAAMAEGEHRRVQEAGEGTCRTAEDTANLMGDPSIELHLHPFAGQMEVIMRKWASDPERLYITFEEWCCREFALEKPVSDGQGGR